MLLWALLLFTAAWASGIRLLSLATGIAGSIVVVAGWVPLIEASPIEAGLVCFLGVEGWFILVSVLR